MTRIEKLFAKLFDGRSRINPNEIEAIMLKLGYSKNDTGSSSIVKFEQEGRPTFSYHLPHNGKKEVPNYVVKELRAFIRKEFPNV